MANSFSWCQRGRWASPDPTIRNPDWTPAEGTRIDAYYRPLIAAYENDQDTLREDYSVQQWQRYQTWIALLDRGLSLRRLLFARRVWEERGFGDG